MFKSEHDSIFPCSEIVSTFKLFIKLGVDSHLACINKNIMLKLKKTDNRYLALEMSFPSLFDLLVALKLDLLVALGLPLLDSLGHPLVVALVFLLVTLGFRSPLLVAFRLLFL